MDETFTTKLGALFIQPDGPGTIPYYVGCHDMEDLSEGRGDLNLIQCLDDMGRYVTVGYTQDAPAVISTTLTTYVSGTRDWLEKLMEDERPFAAYFHLRKGGKAGTFGNYQRSYFMLVGGITERTVSNLISRAEDAASEHAFALAGLPPVYSGTVWGAVRLSTSETEAVNAIAANITGKYQSVNGGTLSSGDVLYASTDAAAGSPSNIANVLKSTNGGATWAATSTNPFAAAENIGAIAYFAVGRDTNRVLVVRASTDAGNPAEVAYSDNAGATWTAVNVGSVNGQFCQGIHAMFVLDAYNIWIGMDDGYLYKSQDGGASWALLDAGTFTANGVNVIHFINTNIGYLGADTDDVLYTDDGGATWAAKTATGGGGNVTDVYAHTAKFVWASDSTGSVYVSFDGATTWTERTFSGSGSGSCPTIEFINQFQGVMIHNTGSVGTVFITIDGGYTWEAVSTPTNSLLNDIVYPSAHLAYVTGEVNSSTGFLAKLSS